MFRLAALIAFTGLATMGQWLNLPTPGIPRLADGKPNLKARAPRTKDGKPDFSGLWSRVGAKYSNNIAADLAPGDVAPWADELYLERRRSYSREGMTTVCLPYGPAYLYSNYQDTRIVQTPTLIAMLNSDLTHREIFMDGRKLEA